MIGIVVVSHSPALAQAAVDLALEMGGEAPPTVRIAAGTSDGSTGTDAVAIAAAIDEVASPDGVLVLMDLGSAILSAGMALEFVSSDAAVRLSDAPFVEGLIAAVVVAGSGASLDDVDAEVRRALDGKIAQLDGAPGTKASAEPAAAPTPESATPAAPATNGDAVFTGVIRNPSGLHARPAAVFVKTVGRYDAKVTITDLGSGKAPASGASLISLMSLGVTQGAKVRIDATGPEATEVIGELENLVAQGFGEL
ncbi:dihydroxyacetone kinase phosphoryl donor subunit DhaM [Microbacterium sp. NPDC076911]|uniref:dihydroxyacetone kinase phosphoryl donor subunit DhaM n=1 Tax=Microbacterium sp. NPDC076911 TaxID=3154958 RepID=UPI003441D700